MNDYDPIEKQLADCEAGLREHINFPAALTKEQVGSMEEHAQNVGMARRTVLVAQSMDSAALMDFANEHPESFMAMYEMISDFSEHAEGVLKIAQSSMARMMCVLAMTKHIELPIDRGRTQ